MKRSFFGIVILSGILSVCAYGSPYGCEGEREHCDVRCSRKHPRNVYNRERCFNRCEERFDVCRRHYYPERFDPYPPVIVEPYPLIPWWGRGWGHHHHHHHWR